MPISQAVLMLFEAVRDGDRYRIERAEIHLELCVRVDELCCAQLRKEEACSR